MKIVFITTSLARGGADNLILATAKIFTDNNYDVLLYTQKRSKKRNFDFDKFNECNCSIKMPNIFIENLNLLFSYLAFPLILFMDFNYYCKNYNLKSILKIIKKCQLNAFECLSRYYLIMRITFNHYFKKYDYLFLFHYSNILSGIYLSKIIRGKIIYIEISSPKWRSINKIIPYRQNKFIQKNINKSYIAIVVPSETIKNEFLDSYSTAKLIHIIPFFVELDKTNFTYKPKHYIYGMIGRLVKEKGFDTLIKSLKILYEDEINYKLYILGDGPEKNNLLLLAKLLGVEEYLTIYPPETTVKEFMSMIDLITSMSHVEGMSLTLIEALAYSKPIIATNVGSNSSMVVDGKNGYLLEQPDEYLLAKNIKDILSNKILYDNFSTASHAFYNEIFSMQAIRDKYYTLLTI